MHGKQQFYSSILRVVACAARAALALLILLVFTVAWTPSTDAQTFAVIHSFTGGPDGGWPQSGLTMDAAGNLYGTAYIGGYTTGDCSLYGAGGCGTVFKLSKQGVGRVFSTLYMFRGYLAVNGDGVGPEAPVVIGPDGSLYSTTEGGGKRYGTVFRLHPPANPSPSTWNAWDETLLYSFDGIAGGYDPRFGPVAFGSDGAIYLTTVLGGAHDQGAVVKLTPSNGTWTESVLYSFGGRDGYYPDSGVILDEAGNLYGTTNAGGAYGNGVLFQLIRSGSGWTENLLYEFRGADDGRNPFGSLIFDKTGNLYGTTSTMGGPGNGGTVYKLTHSGDNWTFAVIHALVYGSEGQYPSGGVIFDPEGNLYGVTLAGGPYWAGTVYKLTPSDNGWIYTSLHEFTGGDDGGQPYGTLVLDPSGKLYGITWVGGPVKNCSWSGGGCGVVYEIAP